jgi:hypothetical protein
MRKFFKAKEGCVLIDADYSQIELRVLAHVANDKEMMNAFNNGDDIHAITASQVFNMPLMMVTPLMRSRAKAVNFGIVYGIGAFSLAKDIGVSRAEADSYIKGYLAHFGGVREYMKDVVERAKEDYQIIPDTQEAIISENMWLRVQELRKHKRRNSATGRKSLFSGLVYCADCGSKLHFCASKSLKPNQEFFRCANYKDGRGTCDIHFIRNVVLEAIVLDTIRELADFVACYENAFTYLVAKKKGENDTQRIKMLQSLIESSRKRIADLDRLFSRIYEDNINGKISDERYSRMASEYENEQNRLMTVVDESEKELAELQKKTVDLRMLLAGLREFTEMRELSPIIVNKLIKRIVIHKNEKKHSHNNVKVEIYFTAVGLFTVPQEQELLQMIEEIRKEKEISLKPA